MNIVFVLDDGLDKPDGVQQYIISLGFWLKGRGHQVYYLVGQTRRKDISNVHSLTRNVKVSFNGNVVSAPLPANKKQIKIVLAEIKPDVLHVQMPFSPFLAGRIIKLASKQTAIVGTFHILPYSSKEIRATRALRPFIRKSLKKINPVFSVSAPAAKFARKSLKIKSSVLPNFVDVARYNRAEKLKRYDDDKLNILFLGRLVERKGCMQLLKALKIIHEKHLTLNVRVLICGAGPYRSQLEKFVKTNHLGHIVSFVGFVSEQDKPRYFASADIAIFPSLGGESFGIVLLEAMASGKSVVMAGNNPGYASVLKNRPDQLFDPLDTSQFAKKLEHFVRSYRSRQSARKWQNEEVWKYDVHKIGAQLEAIYQEACK